MMAPTIKDVAARAGVSSATVSHVVNGTRHVSDQKREKVELAIEELKYTPNAMARNFKTGKRNTVGFVVPDISNIFFSAIIEEVEIELSRHGYKLIIANTQETPARELEHIRSLSTGLVDGLIIASTLNDYSDIAGSLPKGFPVVMVDRRLDHCEVDQVLLSSESAIRQGVAGLIAKGHTRIGFIAGLERLFTTKERLKAYRNALSEHGIEPDDSLICYANSLALSARPKALDLLNANCTAIVVGSNIMTMDTVQAALQYKQDTGKNCEILGYGFGEWYSWLSSLTTIIVPTREVGRIAGQRMLQRLEQPDAPPKEIILTSIYPRQ